MPKEKAGDYYCLHHQNMSTSNTSLPDGCACLWNRSFLVELSKWIAVESNSKLSHNLQNSVFINVDVTAMAMKQSLILQVIKLNAVLTCTVERRYTLIYTHIYEQEWRLYLCETNLPVSSPLLSLLLIVSGKLKLSFASSDSSLNSSFLRLTSECSFNQETCK
jgi:hypothetical protein